MLLVFVVRAKERVRGEKLGLMKGKLLFQKLSTAEVALENYLLERWEGERRLSCSQRSSKIIFRA